MGKLALLHAPCLPDGRRPASADGGSSPIIAAVGAAEAPDADGDDEVARGDDDERHEKHRQEEEHHVKLLSDLRTTNEMKSERPASLHQSHTGMVKKGEP